MSQSRDPVHGEERLVRYLLGLLPDDETERLDERSIVDEDVAARLRDVENDLVDAYVRGTLDGTLLERFESVYLASPRRRERVKFAARFLDAVDRTAAPRDVRSDGEPVRRPGGGSETHGRLVPRSWLAWPMGVAAVLLLTCGVLLLRDVRLQRGVRELQQKSAALDERARALAGQLDEQRAANGSMAQQLGRARAAAVATIAPVLLPQTRGAGPVPVIALSPGAAVVPFELQLEANDFSGYELALRDPGTNGVIWRSPVLVPSSSRRLPTISVAVPARLLKPQHYSFELSGRNAAASEIVGSYAFQIASR